MGDRRENNYMDRQIYVHDYGNKDGANNDRSCLAFVVNLKPEGCNTESVY